MVIARFLLWYGNWFPEHRGKRALHDRIRRLARIEIDQEQIVERRGLKWALNPSDFAQSHLFWFGARDPWEMYHLIRLLPRDAVMLQAGANFGYYAATIAKALSAQCRILALEPCQENFLRLVRHIEWNKLQNQIECISVAVSDKDGMGRMIRPPENTGHAHLVSGEQGEPVKFTTIDRVVRDARLEKLDALLIDVEGYEDRALHGATETLRRFRPMVLIELWPPVLRKQGTTVEAAVDVLRAHHYRLYYALRGQLLPVTTLPSGDDRIYAFCFHRDRIPPGLETGSA